MGEPAYLNLVHQVLTSGELIEKDRTGTGTRSIFAPDPIVYDLREGFPLFTTKSIPLRVVFEELMFFIRGETDGLQLIKRGVKIWEKNGERAFLDKCGFSKDREEHDLGPIYGFQWRHFGAEYKGINDYEGKGFDQLAWLIHAIKTRDPVAARRLVLTAYDPSTVQQAVLPPCHMFCQFSVRENNRLDCQLYQRSGDIGLGVPFNVASYALLMHLVALHTDTVPGRLTHVLGDAHVYLNHFDGLTEQLGREPRGLPRLTIRKRERIEEYEWSDVQCTGYDPHEKIVLPFSA
jgi:thymidylate synthase